MKARPRDDLTLAASAVSVAWSRRAPNERAAGRLGRLTVCRKCSIPLLRFGLLVIRRESPLEFPRRFPARFRRAGGHVNTDETSPGTAAKLRACTAQLAGI